LGLARLRSFLRQHRRLALDTSVFIYQLQAHPRYVSFTDDIFAWIEESDSTAVTSTVTMTELLVHPYREENEEQVHQIYSLLGSYSGLDWIAPNLEIADIAARIRATHRLRTPDALQAATAIQAQVTGFVTNDAVFERVKDFDTLVLDRVL
jgi:predicted nucleic acid-binding protein